MKNIKIPIAYEGYPFIFLSVFVTLIFTFSGLTCPAIACLGITAFVSWFFRDPERIQSTHENAIFSPADGKVIDVSRIKNTPHISGEAWRISIFMSIFNVHVNRSPIQGEVESIFYRPGEFYSANLSKAMEKNEQNAIIIKGPGKKYYVMVQVAGLIARRIVCWAEKGDVLKAGQRIGIIRFGSRVDLYVPTDVKIKVALNEHVRAGETILGLWK